MPTEPLKSLLDRSLSKAQAREVIDLASPLLQEIVNYATVSVERCLDSPIYETGGESDHVAVIVLYLHNIEMADAIEILISHSAVGPTEPILRSLFEGLLSLHYILQNTQAYVQRSLSWLVGYVRDEIAANERLDPNTKEGARLQQSLTKEGGSSLPVQAAEQTTIQANLTAYSALLAEPEFAPIEAEYARLHAKKSYPAFYNLFGGPANLRLLAREVNREAVYDLLYPMASTITHATDMERFVHFSTDRTTEIARLRNPEYMTAIASQTTFLLLETIRLVHEKFLPAESPPAGWFNTEVRDRFFALKA